MRLRVLACVRACVCVPVRVCVRARACLCACMCVRTLRASRMVPEVMDFRAGHLSGFKERTFIWGPLRL